MHWTLTLLVAAAGIQTGFLLMLSLAELLRKSPPASGGLRPFSVIIAAHNEADRLGRNLEAVLQQNYAGPFEVIVALDRCSDDSPSVLSRLKEKYIQLRWVMIDEVPAGYSPKKHALTVAIAAARYPWLAFTDADCRPGPQWLAELNGQCAENSELIIGVSPPEKGRGLLNLLQRYETFITAFLYTNAARMGMPYMAVGRNLAYRKTFFEKAGGFSPHIHRLSGDDDLLVNRNSQALRTRVITTRASMVPTETQKSWGQWLRQKLRHISASGAYSLISKILLGLYQGSQTLFYVSLVLAILLGQSPAALAGIYLLRLFWHVFLLLPSALRWGDLAPIVTYPLWDPGFVLYNLLMVPAGLLKQPKWKKI